MTTYTINPKYYVEEQIVTCPVCGTAVECDSAFDSLVCPECLTDLTLLARGEGDE